MIFQNMSFCEAKTHNISFKSITSNNRRVETGHSLERMDVKDMGLSRR
jgi:hypothetical protein